jgi:hypothetical protein
VAGLVLVDAAFVLVEAFVLVTALVEVAAAELPDPHVPKVDWHPVEQ